jgi:hypothetical protein
MGRNSYLGGSTIVHGGSGWFSRSRAKAATPEQKALDALALELQLYEAEARNADIADAVVRAFYDEGLQAPLDVNTIFEVARFSVEMSAVTLRPARKEAFDAETVRFYAKCGGDDLRSFSSWTMTASDGRSVVAVCCRSQRHPELVGIYPDESEFCSEAAASGWLALESWDSIDIVPEADLRRVWTAAHSPNTHPFWSNVGNHRR